MGKNTYKEHMDSMHVPKEKAEETLRLMLQENRRLREKNVKQISARAGRRIPLYAVAAAACLLLVFFGFQRAGNRSLFYPVDIGSLPAVSVSRGGEEQPIS